MFQDDDKLSERNILEDYLEEYVMKYAVTVTRWGVLWEVVDGAGVYSCRPRPGQRSAGTHARSNEHVQETGTVAVFRMSRRYETKKTWER